MPWVCVQSADRERRAIEHAIHEAELAEATAKLERFDEAQARERTLLAQAIAQNAAQSEHRARSVSVSAKRAGPRLKPAQRLLSDAR